MANPTRDEILFRSGGAELARTGVPWLRGSRFDGREVEKYTFTRADAATCATYVDVNGAVRKAAANKLRQSYDYANSRYGLLAESAATNLCLQSDDVGASPWTASGATVVTTGYATCGVVALNLLADDSGAATEYYYQSFATGVVATGCNALAFYVAIGTSVATSYAAVHLRDSTAAQVRAEIRLTWSGSSVVATAQSGAVLTVVACAGGVYRVATQSTTCLVANGHEVRIYPAAGAAADTGNIAIGGVMLSNTVYPTSHLVTTTAVVTRTADALTYGIGFAPQDLTVYVRMPRPVWADATGALSHACGIVGVGGDGSTGAAIYGAAATREWTVALGGAGTAQTIPAGATQELCAQFRFTTDAKCRLDVGSGFGSLSSAGTATFSSQVLRLGATAVGTELDGAIERIVVARGLFTLAEMQSVAW